MCIYVRSTQDTPGQGTLVLVVDPNHLDISKEIRHVFLGICATFTLSLATYLHLLHSENRWAVNVHTPSGH